MNMRGISIYYYHPAKKVSCSLNRLISRDGKAKEHSSFAYHTVSTTHLNLYLGRSYGEKERQKIREEKKRWFSL